LHTAFLKELEKYTVQEDYIPAIQFELESYYHEIMDGRVDQEAALNNQLSEIQKKIENIEEKYFATGEMSREAFKKYHKKYTSEKCDILRLLQECELSISNLIESIADVISLGTKLNTVWTFGGITEKENLQKLIFPSGIFYDPKNGSFRTPEVNFIFRLIACQVRVSGEDKTGTNHFFDDLSPSAESEGFEPPDL
jgi:hypothetical protein